MMNVFIIFPICGLYICLSYNMKITTAALSNNESITYFFDPTTNVVGVKLGEDCYITKISPAVSATLHQPSALQKFEFHMLELISLHQGQHKKLTLGDFGNIANWCLKATDIYEIADKNHRLLVTEAPTETTTPAFHPRDCNELQKHGVHTSGRYMVYPDGLPHGTLVYCDMETDGGGWLVFQRRIDGHLSFQQNWNLYRAGFGNVSREFWLGNDILHSIVSQHDYTLRMEFESVAGEKRFAVYDRFFIDDESAKYKLTISGYSGNAGADEFSMSNHMKFTTKDSDNSNNKIINCAAHYSGGWWFHNCYACNLNGAYTPIRGHGIAWNNFSKAMKNSEMKIRPRYRT